MRDRNVLLGVCGSIAAYKAVDVLRELTGRGAQVTCILTSSATRFVQPLTFQVLSENPCLVDQFAAEAERGALVEDGDCDRAPIVHIDLARRADLVVVAPASANLIGKVAAGIADDLLSVTLMATEAPVLFAPAMNSQMWANPIVQGNVRRLAEVGYHFAGPGTGELACGVGPGRLLEPEAIAERAAQLSEGARSGPLASKTVVVSAGRTEEPIDPVRTIANRSSGRMGYALARAARDLGARVVLVSGPASVPPPAGVELERVRTAAEMERSILAALPGSDCLIMAAAVADFRPKRNATHKLKRQGTLQLELESTGDILALAAQDKGNRLHVGFALETGDGRPAARAKLERKSLDLIVLNHADEEGAGLDVETNRVVLIDHQGERELPLMHKDEVARQILAEVAQRLSGNGHG